MGFEAGALLAERYRLINPIADGGALGPLWRAVDRTPDRQIAVRLVQPSRSLTADALDAYVREMELARRIAHPAAVRVLDVGRTAEGTPWVATELLQVETLEALLARRTLLPGTALRLVADLAAALAEAHALGLAHLGVEPARVLLHRAGDGSVTAKIDGFGRARLLSSRPRVGSAPVARPEEIVPIAYTSPEQAAGDPKLDRATDVWSLGVLLFRCVAGRTPFGATTRAMHFSEVRGVSRILESAEGSIDPHVLELVKECLRYARAQRPSAEAVADRAQLLAWVTAGGWKDLAKMVRIDEAAVAPALRGELVHVPTIPGAMPAAAPTPPATEPASARASQDASVTKTAPPVACSTPPLDEVPDLRPKVPRAGVYVALGVAALGLGALAMPRSKPARAPAAPKVTVVDRGAEVPAPIASVTSASMHATPESQAATPPAESATATASATSAKRTSAESTARKPGAKADETSTMPSPPVTAGIPLRDDPPPKPKPARAADDNPYH